MINQSLIKKDGGGVMIAVSAKFTAKRRNDLESSLEIIWVELKLDNTRKVFLGTVYLPPSRLQISSLFCSGGIFGSGSILYCTWRFSHHSWRF